MSSNFIIKETDKNLQFTEFNTVLRPWRLHTTSIYHNRNLVTDPSYSDACYNNLYIESHDNDIRLLVNNNNSIINFHGGKGTEFSNNVLFDKDASFNSMVNMTKANITNHLSVDGDISLAGSIDVLGNFKIFELDVAGDISYNGSVDISDRLYVKGDASFNSNVYLGDTLFTKNINISGSIQIPVGTVAERPLPPKTGQIRFNTTENTYEGYDGIAWGSLGGIKDTDGDTYISAESSAGADNDQLDFFTASGHRGRIDECGNFLFGDTQTEFTVDVCGNVDICGKLQVNHITSISGTDLTIEASGNNKIVFLENDISYNLDNLVGGAITMSSYNFVSPSTFQTNLTLSGDWVDLSASGYVINYRPSHSSSSIHLRAKINYINSFDSEQLISFRLVRIIQGESNSVILFTDCSLGATTAIKNNDIYTIDYLDTPNTTNQVTYYIKYQIQSTAADIDTSSGVIGYDVSAINFMMAQEILPIGYSAYNATALDASYRNLDITGRVLIPGLTESLQQKTLYYNTTTGEVSYYDVSSAGTTTTSPSELFYCAKSADDLITFTHNAMGPNNEITNLDNGNSFRISSGGNNIFDQATGIFTCQVAGIYEISCKVSIFGWHERVLITGFTRSNSSASWVADAIQDEECGYNPPPDYSTYRNTETLTIYRELAVGNQVKFNLGIMSDDGTDKYLLGNANTDETVIYGHKMETAVTVTDDILKVYNDASFADLHINNKIDISATGTISLSRGLEATDLSYQFGCAQIDCHDGAKYTDVNGEIYATGFTDGGGNPIKTGFGVSPHGILTIHSKSHGGGSHWPNSTERAINFYVDNSLYWSIRDDGNLVSHDNRDLHCHTLHYTALNPPSDDRLKHNEVDISGLEIIRQLKPQKYQKTSEKHPIDYTGDISCEWNWETGLIAQDILKINDISYSVGYNNVKDTYALNYNNIFVYGLQATKELDIQLQEQQNTINSQQNTITDLSNQVVSLMQQNQIMKVALNQLLTSAGLNTV
jgi:hypothetical protein